MSETGTDKVAPEKEATAADYLTCRGCMKFKVNCTCPTTEESEQEQEHFNMMSPEDELEWLRGQYVELRGMLDSARQGYADMGREASTLRRVLASKAPTVRERAAIAFMAQAINPIYPAGTDTFAAKSAVWAATAVAAADALVFALKGETP